MMLPTHILVSILFMLPLITLFPEYTHIIIYSSIIGGIFPDLDMLIGQHRKTLHNISLYILILLGSIPIYIIYPPLGIILFIVSIVASIHMGFDVLSGGLERKPWLKTSNKAIYNHLTDEWIPPKHTFDYDGSYKDLSFAILLSIVIYTYNIQVNYINIFLGLLLSISILYTFTRKYLPTLENKLMQYPVFKKIITVILR